MLSILVSACQVETSVEDFEAAERSVVGLAKEYPAAPYDLKDPKAARKVVEKTLPIFETWYHKNEITRMYQEMHRGAALDDVFEWNRRYAELTGQTFARKLQDEADVAGLAGVWTVAYSPAMARHLLKNARAMIDCIPRIASFNADDAPLSESNHSLCYDAEFPIDSVVVKSAWSNAKVEPRIKVYEDVEGEWKVAREVEPHDMHEARLADGTIMRLTGLHIVTKELRHWVWITLTWNDAVVSDLPGVWSHYSIQVITDYGDEVASNPYIEKGPGNARSNCIGCHQHAGSAVPPESVITEKKMTRTNFPSDYLWAFDRSSRLARAFAAISNE